MKCRKCGKYLNDGSTFCPYCATVQVAGDAKPAPAKPKAPTDPKGHVVGGEEELGFEEDAYQSTVVMDVPDEFFKDSEGKPLPKEGPKKTMIGMGLPSAELLKKAAAAQSSSAAPAKPAPPKPAPKAVAKPVSKPTAPLPTPTAPPKKEREVKATMIGFGIPKLDDIRKQAQALQTDGPKEIPDDDDDGGSATVIVTDMESMISQIMGDKKPEPKAEEPAESLFDEPRAKAPAPTPAPAAAPEPKAQAGSEDLSEEEAYDATVIDANIAELVAQADRDLSSDTPAEPGTPVVEDDGSVDVMGETLGMDESISAEDVAAAGEAARAAAAAEAAEAAAEPKADEVEDARYKEIPLGTSKEAPAAAAPAAKPAKAKKPAKKGSPVAAIILIIILFGGLGVVVANQFLGLGLF